MQKLLYIVFRKKILITFHKKLEHFIRYTDHFLQTNIESNETYR